MGALPPQSSTAAPAAISSVPPPLPPYPPLPPGNGGWFDESKSRVAFDIETPGIMKLAIVGSLLQFLTLGIYRFWFLVNVRRQLWQRTSLAGSSFEFTGTPGEVFRGFLLSLIFLAPIWGCYFGGSFLANTKDYSVIAHGLTVVAIVGFLFFGYFASYRSGRYRVSRTLWRGVRFRQTGSGFKFALMNFGWWILAIVTLGLSIPFARAQLERYRTGHMWFGDRRFESRASGRAMLGPYLLLYAVVVGPAAGLLLGWYFDVPDLIGNITGTLTSLMRNSQPRLAQIEFRLVFDLLKGAGWGLGWLVITPILLWPAYRARELRSFVGQTHLGAATFQSSFGAGGIYLSYLAFVLATLFWGIVIGALAVVLSGFGLMKFGLVAFGYTIFAYLSFLLAISVMRIRILLFGLGCKLISSITVVRLASLQDVISQRDTVGAVGDDFAGGFDIGAF